MAMFGVRLVAYEPAGARLGVMPEPLAASAAFPHNDVGALSATYSRLALGGGFLDRALSDGLELAVEVTNHAGAWVEPDGARYLWIARKDDLADRTLTVDVTAPSYGWLLNKARLLDLTHLLPDEHSQAGKRPFLSASAGLIVATLQQENATRGGVPVTLGFDSSLDSAGQAWALVSTLYYDPGISTLTVLANLTAQGMCDWRTAARELLLYNPDDELAPDLTLGDNPVALQLGLDVTEAPSDQSLEEIVSRVLLRGDDGLVLTLDNPTAPTPWGPWEGYIEQGGVSDAGTATSLVQTELERTARTRAQFTRGLLLRDDETPGGDAEPGVAWPMVDYDPGAWILGPTTVASERVRVQQVTLTWGGQVDVGGSVVLHDRVLDAELRRAQRVAGIVGGSTSGGAGGGRPAPEGPDRRQPAAPLGLVVDSDAYVNATTGGIEAMLSMLWDDVTTDTSGDLLEVASYDIAVRDNIIGAPWNIVGSADDTDATYSPVAPGAALQVKVRARGRYSTTPGAWSGAVTLTAATDVTPPPVPTGITVDGAMTVVTVAWDGTPTMPGDFARVEVAIGDTTTPTALAGTLTRAGAVQVDQALTPIGAPKYVRARAVDTSGNASDWTAALPVTATSVVAAEIDAAINDAIDQALTGPVDGDRLEPWTVPGNRVLIGDTDSRVPWSPAVSVAPHVGLNGATIVPFNDPDVTWSIKVTGGTETDLTLGNALNLLNGDGDRFPVEPGRSYRVGARIGVGGTFPGARAVDVAAFFFDAAGAFIAGSSFATPSVSGGFSDATLTSGITPPAPANAVTLNLVVRKNFWSIGELYVYQAFLTQAADAELVVDGSIITGKLAADAVEAGNIKVGALDGKLITGATIRTAAGSDRIELSGTSLRSIKAGVTALELTPERLRVYNGGQIGGMHTGVSDFGTFMGPIYNDLGSLLGFGLLVEDYNGDDILHVRTGPSTAGSGTNLYLRNPVGTSHFRSDDGAVIVSANGSNNSLFLSANGTSGIAQLRAGNGQIEFVTNGALRANITAAGSFGIHNMGTSSTGASVVHHVDGWLRELTSSIQFKQDVEDHIVDSAAMLSLRPRSWRDKGEVLEHPDTTNRYAGLIAEEVDAAGLFEFVIYEPDGTPRALAYDRMFVGLLPILQDLVARVGALEGGGPLAMRAMAAPAVSAVLAATVSGQVKSIPRTSGIDTTPTEQPDPTSASEETTSDD